MNDRKNAFLNLRMNQSFGVQPDQSLDVWLGVWTPCLPRRKAADTMLFVQMLVDAVNPPEAQRLLNSVDVPEMFLVHRTATLQRHPAFGLGVAMHGKPGAEFRAVGDGQYVVWLHVQTLRPMV